MTRAAVSKNVTSFTPPTPPDGRPPRGLIRIDGAWHPRRAGFIKQSKLTCWNGHPISTKKQRDGERIPMEGVIICGHRDPPGNGPACDKMTYLFRIRAGRVFAMDVTREEDKTIEISNMDLDDIIDHFGLDFLHR